MGNDTWKNKALIVGGALGTLVGIGAAMLYIRAEEDALDEARKTPVQHKPVPPAAFLPIAIGVLGVLRQISRLSERD
jgi:ABC-type nitrate/sulfonate/bicarbonate transport system permease component